MRVMFCSCPLMTSDPRDANLRQDQCRQEVTSRRDNGIDPRVWVVNYKKIAKHDQISEGCNSKASGETGFPSLGSRNLGVSLFNSGNSLLKFFDSCRGQTVSRALEIDK